MKIDGIEVINALVDDVLNVTEEDISEGVPLDHHKCAIAVRWRKDQPDLQDVYVGKSVAYKLAMHFGYLKWFRYIVSKAILVQEAILDNGGRMSPGTYTLKRPSKSKATGQQQGSNTRPESDESAKKRAEPTLVKAARTRTPMRENAPTRST